MPFSPPLLFIDSANEARVTELFSTGAFHGLTTNPTILERDDSTVRDLARIHAWATAAGAHEVCFQTWGRDLKSLRDNSNELLAIDRSIVVKVPATALGFRVARELIDNGTQVLITAVYRAAQMAIAASIGAHYVAPYFGRISDLGRDAVAEIATMQAISMQGVGKTQILAASLRTLNDVEHLCALGVHAFTLSPALAEAMISDPNSAEATRVFEETVEASLI